MPEGWKPGDPIPMLSAFLPRPPARSSEDGMQEAEAALLRQQPQQLPAPSKEQSDSDNASSGILLLCISDSLEACKLATWKSEACISEASGVVNEA